MYFLLDPFNAPDPSIKAGGGRATGIHAPSNLAYIFRRDNRRVGLLPPPVSAPTSTYISTTHRKDHNALVLSRQEEASDNDYSTIQTTLCRVN